MPQHHKGATMKVHHLYPDANGESHFEDLEIEWVEQSKASKLSKRFPANGVIFREVEPAYDLDWHPAPRRQYIINLTGAVQLTASDGESRVIRAGEVVLVEDVTGKGHLSKSVGDEPRLCVFIPVE
jgi:quercetin dioxygenase-like cupin family protein